MRRLGLVVLAVMLLVAAAVPVAALQVGEKAPEFTLPSTTAEKLSLTAFAGKNVVLFGFIGAFTPT